MNNFDGFRGPTWEGEVEPKSIKHAIEKRMNKEVKFILDIDYTGGKISTATFSASEFKARFVSQRDEMDLQKWILLREEDSAENGGTGGDGAGEEYEGTRAMWHKLEFAACPDSDPMGDGVAAAEYSYG